MRFLSHGLFYILQMFHNNVSSLWFCSCFCHSRLLFDVAKLRNPITTQCPLMETGCMYSLMNHGVIFLPFNFSSSGRDHKKHQDLVWISDTQRERSRY